MGKKPKPVVKPRKRATPTKPVDLSATIQARSRSSAKARVRSRREIVAWRETLEQIQALPGVKIRPLTQAHGLATLTPVSRKAKALHAYVSDYIRENGIAPTYEDIADGAHMGNSTIRDALQELSKAGVYEHPRRRPASSKPVGKP